MRTPATELVAPRRLVLACLAPREVKTTERDARARQPPVQKQVVERAAVAARAGEALGAGSGGAAELELAAWR